MKLWLVLLSSLFFVQLASAQTEIQMLIGYRGPKHGGYNLKVVSTPNNPVSAWYVYVAPGQKPLAAACYYGDPNEALQLFATMVLVFNAEYNRNLRIAGYPFFDAGSGQIRLHIDAIDERGYQYEWFSHMNVCDRHSTEAERWPKP